MSFPITITIDGVDVAAELNNSETALLIFDALPIDTGFTTWGDELYFSIPVSTGLEDAKDVVELGDLGYWPPGNAFCIFYGATPGSTVDEIKPASPVNVIGRVKGDPEVFHDLAGRADTVRVTKA